MHPPRPHGGPGHGRAQGPRSPSARSCTRPGPSVHRGPGGFLGRSGRAPVAARQPSRPRAPVGSAWSGVRWPIRAWSSGTDRPVRAYGTSRRAARRARSITAEAVDPETVTTIATSWRRDFPPASSCARRSPGNRPGSSWRGPCTAGGRPGRMCVRIGPGCAPRWRERCKRRSFRCAAPGRPGTERTQPTLLCGAVDADSPHRRVHRMRLRSRAPGKTRQAGASMDRPTM